MLCFSPLILLWIFGFLHSGPAHSYSRKAQMLRPILLLPSKTSTAFFSSLSLPTTLRMNSRKRLKPDSFSNHSISDMSNGRSTSSSTMAAASTAENEQQQKPLVIVIAGPTAVGKSDVASKICSSPIASDICNGHQNKHNAITKTANLGHIISADSVQAYRGVDIGSNKPTVEEMERTPHHLVNVVDPPTDPSKAASYNAADWLRDATYVIRELSLNDDDLDEIELEDLDADSLLRKQSIDAYLQQTLGDASNDSRQPILPVVVGGTMMYLNWFVHGRPDAIRPTNEAIERAATKVDLFRQAHSSDGVDDDDESLDAAAWKDASTHVSSLGPVFEKRVQKLPGKDWYRLRRLLEVAYTISSEKMKKEGNENIAEDDVLKNLTDAEVYTGIRSGSLKDQYDVRCFFLCPHDRMLHFATVDQRCEQMLQRGLLRETANLYVRGGLPDDSQVTRAIGYRQALEYLQRSDAKNDDHESLAAFIDNFATATRQYAKKQMQWFRRDDDFVFVPVRMDCEKEERSSEAANIISNMCKLSAANFETELTSSDGEENVPLSAKTKIENELQGKKMKFFMSKRTVLSEGSENFLALLKEADECMKMVQEMKSKVS
mmetsp:Transcript_13360/g.20072  ORF Transcript_13360/g.20072 Transcript_13360/m.20072 type:complete len:605 (+) Transcript_13360:53-1867(+)